MHRRACLPTALILLAVAALGAAGQLAEEEPLARVNEHVITRGELDRFRGLRQPVPDLGPPLAEAEQIEEHQRRQALQALIERRLLVQEARERYVSTEGYEQILESFGRRELERLEQELGSRLRMWQVLSERGLTAEQYRRMRIESLLIAKLLNEEVESVVEVGPRELRSHYRQNRQEFALPRRVLYQQVFFPVAEGASEQEVLSRAEAVLAQIRGGADFGRVADRHSADADRYPAGFHDVALPESRPDWRPPAVRGLEPGQVSGVRRVAGGFAIVKLLGVRQQRVRPFAEVQDEIRARLVRRKRASARRRLLERLREDSLIEYYPAAEALGL